MNRFLILLVLFFAGATSVYADAVDLLLAGSQQGRYRGYQWQTLRFEIRLDNLGYRKEVIVRYLDANGDWQALAAKFDRDIDGRQEVWSILWRRVLYRYDRPETTQDPLDFVFRVEYKVNGQTYIDDNNGLNYYLPSNDGELITQPVLADGIYGYRYVVKDGEVRRTGSLHVDVLLKNIAYAKQVKVHYSFDNWNTVHVGQAAYQSSRSQGYDNPTSYPNSNGTEFWYFFTTGPEAQDPNLREAKVAISYTVAGQTYWDNNFGQNYTIPMRTLLTD